MKQNEKNQIIEWCYLNDGKFSDKLAWRKEFIAMLNELYNGEQIERVAEEITTPFTNQDNLKLLSTVKLKATDGKGLISKSSKVFKSYIDSDFTNWSLNEKQKPTKIINLNVFELTKDSTFKEIFTRPDKMIMTQSQIIEFCKNHKERLSDYYTFFLIKVNDEYFVVRVRVNSDGLSVRVHRFEDDYVWHAEYRRRLVAPQL